MDMKRQFTQHLRVQLETNKYCYMCFTEIVNLNNPTVTHTSMQTRQYKFTFCVNENNNSLQPFKKEMIQYMFGRLIHFCIPDQ